jgi:hypothetical protein
VGAHSSSSKNPQLPQQQQQQGARAADWRRGHILTYTARAVDVGRVPARKASKGKRDKYRYEAECVTDVPIGCILNL